MATILSTNLLQFIMPIILFIFIFSIFYAILIRIKVFSDNKPLNSLIAFSVTILFLIIPEARLAIELATPWFVVFVVFGLLLITAFMILGVEAKTIKDLAEDNAVILGVVIGGMALIFMFSLTQVFGNDVLRYPGQSESTFFAIVKRTVLNPKILGLVVLMILAGEVVRRVGYPSTK